MLTMSSKLFSTSRVYTFCFHCHFSVEFHHLVSNPTKAGLISISITRGTNKISALALDPLLGVYDPEVCVFS